MDQTFGEYLKGLRKSKKLTLQGLSDSLEYDLANLSKVENGKREFDEKRLPKLCEIFDLDINTMRKELVSEKIALEVLNKGIDKGITKLIEQKLTNWQYKKEMGPIQNFDTAALKLKSIDLFCGIGGFRVALENLGVENVFSSDIDIYAQKTYETNFGDKPVGDIKQIEADEIPQFDIMTGGFPCQPFSYAGKNKGFEDENRGTLFFDILRILKHHRPKMFLLENVKGLKSHNGGQTMEAILTALKVELEYDVHWTVLNSYDFGVPQYRERWYCVGFDKKVEFKFPVGNKAGSKLKDIIDVQNNDPGLKISDFEMDRIRFHFENSHLAERVNHDNSKYEPHTKKGKHGVYSYHKKDGAIRFHVGDAAKTQIQEAFYCSKESYAPTIIANRVPKLWDIGRKLSVDEAKKLQGFPDTFHFPVSANQAYKQLGNAVTVTVVQEILKNMLFYYIRQDEIKEANSSSSLEHTY